MTSWPERLSSLRRIALDTNVIIYKLENATRYSQLVEPVFGLLNRGRIAIILSRVVEMEALVRPLRDNDRAAVDVLTLLFARTPNLRVRDVDQAIAHRAADVRAITRLRAPDAIIAATALEERCEALIGNDKIMASRLRGIPYLYLDDYI